MSKNPEQLTGEALYTYIRAAYPNPVPISTGRDIDNAYCVGGALSLAIGNSAHFPLLGELSNILKKANPNLTRREALADADYIMTLNDNKRIDEAWHTLHTALTYQGEPK